MKHFDDDKFSKFFYRGVTSTEVQYYCDKYPKLVHNNILFLVSDISLLLVKWLERDPWRQSCLPRGTHSQMDREWLLRYCILCLLIEKELSAEQSDLIQSLLPNFYERYLKLEKYKLIDKAFLQALFEETNSSWRKTLAPVDLENLIENFDTYKELAEVIFKNYVEDMASYVYNYFTKSNFLDKFPDIILTLPLPPSFSKADEKTEPAPIRTVFFGPTEVCAIPKREQQKRKTREKDSSQDDESGKRETKRLCVSQGDGV